jgi:hypothetical protein
MLFSGQEKLDVQSLPVQKRYHEAALYNKPDPLLSHL